MKNNKIPVVIRYSDMTNTWGICHAKSYQNAFRNSINKFESRQEAAKFAEDNGCDVRFNDFDQLQAIDAQVLCKVPHQYDDDYPIN